jgi:hypothetical protein
MDVTTLFLLILELWIMLICWNIFLRRNIKGFLSITLSSLLFFLSYSFKNMTGTVLSIASEVLLGTGATVIMTLERNEMKEFWEATKIVDWLSGRIPKSYNIERRLLSLFENALLVICSALLIILSVTDYFIFHGDLTGELSVLFAGMALIIYNVTKSRHWKNKIK